MPPKFFQMGGAHDLLKINKYFGTIPSIQPIVDTINTPHFEIDEFLAPINTK